MAIAQAQPRVRYKIPTRSKLIVLTAVMASLLEIIDTSIVNVAIPTMMGNLGATLDEISWVVTGYIIANAVVLPIAGWMSEQIGRKNYYTGCIVLFTVASVACGLAPNLQFLTIFRVIQGLAGGALLPTSQALIYEAFPKEQAGLASAIFGMSVMIGPTVGPTLGGYLTDTLGWRSIFNINIPVGIVVAILSWVIVEDVGHDAEAAKAARLAGMEAPKKKRERKPIDLVGLLLLIVGIGCLQYVLERGHADDWFASRSILFCTIAAVFGLVGLIWWELRIEHPLIQLRHFRNTTFRSGIFLMSALGCMLYGLVFLIPIFVTTVQGLTATQTGELFIPGALAGAAMMPFIGSQLRKRDPRILIFVGVSLLAVSVALVARFDMMTSVDGMFWPLLLRGAAMAYLFVPINTIVLVQFHGAAIGEAAGMLNLCRQLGGSICIAMLSTLLEQYSVRSYAAITSHLTALDPWAVQTRGALLNSMHAKFAESLGLGNYNLDAIKVLYFSAQKQAFVIGFQRSMFTVVIVFLLLALPPLFLMKPARLPQGKPLPDAH